MACTMVNNSKVNSTAVDESDQRERWMRIMTGSENESNESGIEKGKVGGRGKRKGGVAETGRDREIWKESMMGWSGLVWKS